MADLFGSLTAATRSLEAQRYALEVTGQNIANVNTPGYTRRVVDFSAVAPTEPRDAGRGVRVDGIRAQRDMLTERRIAQEASGAERETATAELLSLAEVAVGGTGEGLGPRLNAFFDSLARLTESPTSVVARQEVFDRGASLAAAFRGAAEQFETLQREADRRVDATVSAINDLTTQIAAINKSLTGQPPSSGTLQLQDEQNLLVRKLSELTEISVIARTEGGVDIDVAGQTLVVGETAYEMGAETPVADPTGLLVVTIRGANITDQLSGGKIAGYLSVRDDHIPAYLEQLDAQAWTLADAFNTIHASGFGLNGTTTQDFFAFTTPPVGAEHSGAAAGLVLDQTLDPSRIAAADANVRGDNRNAQDLVDLRTALLLDGGNATLSDSVGQLAFSVGHDLQNARSEASLREDIVLQLETLRDQVSGISLDEEAMSLVRYQRAYEANARFFTVIDQTLDVLMSTVGR